MAKAMYPASITGLSNKHGFILSAKYDQAWMFANGMGPNPMWLTEWLMRAMPIEQHAIVLDMGCGKAVSSVFLAREFGCTVFANDLWIEPEENLLRINEAGLRRQIFPIKAEAHALPYAKGFFDAIVCIDAYLYFGTDDMYLSSFHQYVKPGGSIGIVVPGLRKDFSGKPPKNLEAFPLGEFTSFHTRDWWEQHWKRTGLVNIDVCEEMPDGPAIWLDSACAMYETLKIRLSAEGASKKTISDTLKFWQADVDLLKADKGEYFTLLRMVAHRLG